MNDPPKFDGLAAVHEKLAGLIGLPLSAEAIAAAQADAAWARDYDREMITDPPSPAADMLGALLGDAAEFRNLTDGLTFSGIHDGDAPAVVVAAGGDRFVLACIPVPAEMLDRAVREPGLLARVHADVELSLTIPADTVRAGQ